MPANVAQGRHCPSVLMRGGSGVSEADVAICSYEQRTSSRAAPPTIVPDRRRSRRSSSAGVRCASSSASTPPRRISISDTRCPLRKLRQFQDLGHRVVLIIGDFTALDRRPVRAEQHAPAADARGDRGERRRPTSIRRSRSSIPTKTEMRRNSEWLGVAGLRGHPAPGEQVHGGADPRAGRLLEALRRAAAASRCTSSSTR